MAVLVFTAFVAVGAIVVVALLALVASNRRLTAAAETATARLATSERRLGQAEQALHIFLRQHEHALPEADRLQVELAIHNITTNHPEGTPT